MSYTVQLRFARALSIVRAIPQESPLQPTAADKLQFYGLYKQASEGDVNIPRPSSRQVVDYAKWKAWSRMKGMSPMEAQRRYVESLIQLLTEFIQRYPHHEQTELFKKALHSLQCTDGSSMIDDDEFFQDAYDPTEFELQENFLNHIEPDQLMQQDDNSSSSPTSSFQRHHRHHHHHHQHKNSYLDSPNEYPLTPITSPGQNSVTGQWVLNQLQQNKYVHPMDFLQQQQQQQHLLPVQPHQDVLSEADTFDREVAAATSNLRLSSPRQSPYSSHIKPSSASTSTSSQKKSNSSTKKISKKSDRALERLQTEVTALTEQIDRLRRDVKIREEKDKQRKWSAMNITKVLIKHLMANSAILLIAFYILWRRKSPIAYAILSYITPMIRDVIRKIIQRVVFWKVTV